MKRQTAAKIKAAKKQGAIHIYEHNYGAVMDMQCRFKDIQYMFDKGFDYALHFVQNVLSEEERKVLGL